MNNGEQTADPELVSLMDSVFSDRYQARANHDIVPFDRELWDTLDSLGLTRLTGCEDAGGSGATWRESGALLGIAAQYAAPLPLAEHDLLSNWLLGQAGLPLGANVTTACLLDETGVAFGVPWAAEAERITVLWSTDGVWQVVDLPASALAVEPGVNLAGHPRAQVRADIASLRGQEVPEGTAEGLLLRGALARSLQMCGAMERIVALCVRHTLEREQFGRHLARFQAIQHLVADVAAEAALARASTEAALTEALDSGFASPGLALSIAVARSCTGHAATVVVRNAHQVHGAIGTTLEHDLSKYTKAVLAWRSECGSVRFWDELLTDAALAAGRDGAWGLVTEGAVLEMTKPVSVDG